MKALLITHKGIEDVSEKEIKEIIKTNTQIKESAVMFEIKKLEDACLVCYKSQSAIKVLYLLTEFDVEKNFEKTTSSLKKQIEALDLKNWVKKTVKITCKRLGAHDFSSIDIAAEATKLLAKKYKIRTDFKNPETTLFIYIFENQGYFGIDLAGIDLSKRDYNIFPNPAAPKGTIAYALLRLADYKKENALLDPYVKSGIIPIEAALFANNISPNYYQKNELAFTKFAELKEEKKSSSKTKIFGTDSQMNNIRAAEKNAKIAGVKKGISFSRMDIDWLDTKFKKGQIDKIVTLLPSESKRLDETKITKIYNEFLYQAEYILNKEGIILAITRSPEKLVELAAKYNFKTKERTVWSGKEELKIVILQK